MKLSEMTDYQLDQRMRFRGPRLVARLQAAIRLNLVDWIGGKKRMNAMREVWARQRMDALGFRFDIVKDDNATK